MKRKRKFAKPDYYLYTSAKISIKSDVQIYEEQVTQICDIITQLLHVNSLLYPGREIARRIVTEVGNTISKASFEYNEETGEAKVELSGNPID